MPIKNICCIGAGYVGGPTMAVIADQWPEITINIVDVNEKRIKDWNDKNYSKLPVFEPGLEKIIRRCRDRNLHFSTNVRTHISEADMVFISVNTPTKLNGIGAGEASDLKWVEACAREIAAYASGYTIVVEKSTLPLKTAEVIRTILDSSNQLIKSERESSSFDVLSNPEFLAEGTAINDLKYPDRVLIGGENKQAMQALIDIYKRWVPIEKIISTNTWSSELSKLVANAFLAQRISSINSISALCEATGADINEVASAIGFDSRIGKKFLNSGPGFGGSCFKKDILNLVYLSKQLGLQSVANYWEGVLAINIWQQNRISRIIIEKLFGTISSKKISILGFSFKANTNDTRESASIRICNDLLNEGALLYIHDPKVNISQVERELDDFSTIQDDLFLSNRKKLNSGKWKFTNNMEEVFEGSDAVVVLTDWSQYSEIKWENVVSKMRTPAWVFDTRSILNSDSVISSGINYWRLGDGARP